MTENEEEEGDMIRCSCGLIVAPDKMEKHVESEHFVKTISDYYKEKNELEQDKK